MSCIEERINASVLKGMAYDKFLLLDENNQIYKTPRSINAADAFVSFFHEFSDKLKAYPELERLLMDFEDKIHGLTAQESENSFIHGFYEGAIFASQFLTEISAQKK
ncbi:hypothetical protein [Bacillus testis]|uniref:hypothetical protein n=1 Tax=Bacillus testis TaxID=1622072 RepID=UPI00067EA8A9|nr:hypothetical protein [Bacillus testis]